MEKIIYKDSIVTFDIETTSLVDETVRITKRGTKKVEQKKYAFMYCGAVYNNGAIFHFRKWKEIKEYFLSLTRLCKPNERYICWVHNLSFEFQFMKDWMKMEDVFCRKAHNVIKCRFGNVEFRDSLALANCKLETLAQNEHLGVEKATGDLDYSLIRHHETPITEKEWNYQDMDVIVLAEYIKKKVKEYGSLGEIPLTSTGEVRYLFRKELGKYGLAKCNNLAIAYSAKSMELQNLLIQIYAGAYTHGNYQYIGEVLDDLECYDIASSYPFQMVAEKYPTVWFKAEDPGKIRSLKELREKYDFSKTALACVCTFHGLEAKHAHNIISQHKCILLDDDPIIDNGRVVSSTILKIAVNEIDMENIDKFYDYGAVEVENLYTSRKQYLPKELVSVILKLFVQKTSLKDIEEEYDNYMRSKNRINGVYGMTVFDILNSGSYFDEISNCKFLKEEKTFKDFQKYVKNPNNYLWYSIGVWVTSYARRQILTPISKLSENAIYSDTDSVKVKDGYRYKKMWAHLNAECRTKFNDAMKFHRFKKEEYQFFDKHGVQHFMGIFEEEKPYKRFKCLGSKRYLVEYYNGYMKSTVAGAPRDLADHLGNTNDEKFKNFTNNFSMKDCKLTHTYTEGNTLKIVTDYLGNTEIVDIRSGVCLTPADFTMNMADNFLDFLSGKINLQDRDIYKYFTGSKGYKR